MRKLIAIIASGLIVLFGASAMASTLSALTSMDTQVAKAASAPYAVTMTGEASSAIKIEGSKITVLRAGDFYMSAAAQVGGTATGNVYLWMRVNGTDVPDSNSIQTVPSPAFTAVLVSQTGMTFKKGDVLEFVYAATAPGLGLIASKPAGMPGVPSIIVSIFDL